MRNYYDEEDDSIVDPTDEELTEFIYLDEDSCSEEDEERYYEEGRL